MSILLRNPNPKTFAFLLPVRVLHEIGSAQISRENENNSILARIVFGKVPEAVEVFIGKRDDKDYMNVTKNTGSWSPEEMSGLGQTVYSFLAQQQTNLINEAAFKVFEEPEFEAKTFPEIVVKDLFDSAVRPHVQKDGGDIVLKKVIDNEGQPVDVVVTMKGACVGCISGQAKTIADANGWLAEAFNQLAEELNGKTFGKILVEAAKPPAP